MQCDRCGSPLSSETCLVCAERERRAQPWSRRLLTNGWVTTIAGMLAGYGMIVAGKAIHEARLVSPECQRLCPEGHGTLTVTQGPWSDSVETFKHNLFNAQCGECAFDVFQVPPHGVGALQKVASLTYSKDEPLGPMPIPHATPPRPAPPPVVAEEPPAPPVVEHAPPPPVPVEEPPQDVKGHFGMTWGLVRNGPGYAHVGCAGTPKLARSSRNGDCDPYRGDTSCKELRPLLCVHDGATKPSQLPDRSDAGWSNMTLGLTMPIPGTALTSLNEANRICEKTKGAGWRLAEFHDGGGWGFVGGGKLDTHERFWVHINDQRGNCWDPR